MNNKQIGENLLKISLVIIVFIFIILMLIKRFVYFRPSSQFKTTKEVYKVVKYDNLHTWLLENNKSDKIVLLCHGNAGNISDQENRINNLYNIGYSVLVFDYSGFGKSSGVPSEQQLYNDVSTIVSILRQQYNPNQIILYGQSLGASVATYAARRYSIPTLILESPLPSVKILIENKYPLGKLYSFLFPEFDIGSYLLGYKGKSLIMHSPTDEMIPYKSITHLLHICTQHIPMDGSHNNPIIPWSQIKNFIEN